MSGFQFGSLPLFVHDVRVQFHPDAKTEVTE